MSAQIPLCPDYSAAELRALATQVRDSRQSRRLLSLAAVMDGMSRGDAARTGGVVHCGGSVPGA